MQTIKKIVVIGPESTGKSTLCTQLAAHYNTTWCPEYARDYLLQNGIHYTYDDLLTIAYGQLALEDQYVQEAMAAGKQHVFIDTDLYVMKVWCEFVYGKCHPEILSLIPQRSYTHYLFCNIDLPWVQDELREYPNEQPRRELYNMYKDILLNQPTPFTCINGGYEQRLQTAIAAVDALQ